MATIALGENANKMEGTTSNVVKAGKVLNISKLPIVSSLKKWIVHNKYYRSLLCTELAKHEAEPEQCWALLSDAKACIEEVQQQEEALKTAFADLTTYSYGKPRFPCILARSHRFAYVCPVASEKKITSTDNTFVPRLRVLCKEEGSGTEISIYNNDMGGCEKYIEASKLKSSTPMECSIKICPLHTGERYVFGSMASDTADKIMQSSLSPSAPTVLMVNPLPTPMLWFSLHRTICDLSATVPIPKDICDAASDSLFNRFIRVTPERDPVTIGRGFEVFLYREMSIRMLEVHQSSPINIDAFLTSFIAQEKMNTKLMDDAVAHGGRKAKQLACMEALHRSAVVTYIASTLSKADVIAQSVAVGYSIVTKTVRYDTIQLSPALQTPLTTFIIALQSIDRQNWYAIHHKLYCRIFAILIRVAVYNKNLSPVLYLLEDFYPLGAAGAESNKVLLPPTECCIEYVNLLALAKVRIDATHLLTMTSQIGQLFTEVIDVSVDNYNKDEHDGVGYVWYVPTPTRLSLVDKCVADFALPSDTDPSPDFAQMMVWCAEKPLLMSDYLSTLLYMGVQLSVQEKASSFDGVLKKLPILSDYFPDTVLKLHTKWELQVTISIEAHNLFKSTEVAVSPKKGAKPAKAAKPAKGAKGAPPPVEEVLDPANVPERFLTASPEEVGKLMTLMGQITLHFATMCFTDDTTGKVGPGPYNMLDLAAGPGPQLEAARAKQASEESKEEVVEEAPPPDPKAPAAKKGTAPVVDEAPSAPDRFAINKAYYIRLLGASIDYALASQTYASAIYSAAKLWEFIISSWFDPAAFAAEFTDMKAFICEILQPITSVLEALSDKAADEAMGGEDSESSREIKEHLLTVQNLIMFLIKVEWLFEEYSNVVSFGSRVLDVYLTTCPEVSKKYGDTCIPIMMHAQELLIVEASGQLEKNRGDMQDIIDKYEDMQRKKRKRATRIASTEKSPDEMVFEAKIDIAQGRCNVSSEKLEDMNSQYTILEAKQKMFRSHCSSGALLLNNARKTSKQLLVDLRKEYGDGDFQSLYHIDKVEEKVASTVFLYNQIIDFLREKKESLVLIEALKEKGDFLLKFGRIETVRHIWHDSIDVMFNQVQSYLNWKKSCDDALDKLNMSERKGALPIIIVLGKLCKFCVPLDWDARSGYALMSTELCKIFFRGSYGHPHTAIGYAAYCCAEVSDCMDLLESNNCSAHSTCVSLTELINCLMAEEHWITVMPLLCLLEYIYQFQLNDPILWLQTRLTRVRVLVEALLLAEAVSMLSAIQSTMKSIEGKAYRDLYRKNFAEETKDLEAFETASNGLNFYNTPPFVANLPPNASGNQESLEWVAGFSAEFDVFCCGKGVEGGSNLVKGMSEKEVDLLSAQMRTTCAHFLFKIAALDTKVSAKHSPFLANVGVNANVLVNQAMTTMHAMFDENMITAASWLSLYCRICLVQNDYYIHTRMYKQARADLSSLCNFLQCDYFRALSGSVRNIVAQTWFAAKYRLCTIAERQGRYEDVMEIVRQSSDECSAVLSGFWYKAFLFCRARCYYQKGELDLALVDCDNIIRHCKNSQVDTVTLVQCITFKVSILSAGLVVRKDYTAVKAVYLECIMLSRQAQEICQGLALRAGAFVAESNLTYKVSDSAVSAHSLLNPVLHNLTNIADNEQNLGLKKYYSPVYVLPVPNSLDGLQESLEDKYVDFSVVNIYLAEVKNLILCQVSLCALLNDVRNSRLLDDPEKIVSDLQELGADSSMLAKEEMEVGEKAFKMMRQCLYLPTQVKVAIIAIVARCRVLKGLGHAVEDKVTSPFNLFKSALQLAVESSHPWELMKYICIQLVEVSIGVSGEACYNMDACKYFDLAVKVKNQLNVLDKKPCSLVEEASFSIESSPMLLSIVSNCFLKDSMAPSNSDRDSKEAIYYLSSLLRESKPLWLDSIQLDMMADLCWLLGQACPLYAQKCLTSTLLSDETPFAAAECAVSSIWQPAFIRNDPPPPTPGQPQKKKGPIPPEDTFEPYLTTYLLLGNVSESASKHPDSVLETSGGSGASTAPVFIKLVLSRVTAVDFEKSIRALSEQFAESAMSEREDLAKERLEMWGTLIQSMVELFRSSSHASSSHKKVVDIGPIDFSIVSVAEGKVSLSTALTSFTFVIDASMIKKLCDVFSPDIAVDSFVDYYICTLLRFSLGYL